MPILNIKKQLCNTPIKMEKDDEDEKPKRTHKKRWIDARKPCRTQYKNKEKIMDKKMSRETTKEIEVVMLPRFCEDSIKIKNKK